MANGDTGSGNWTGAAMFGLAVGQTLLAAHSTARQARTQKGLNKQAIGHLDTSLGFLGETALYQTEAAQDSYGQAFDVAATKTSTMYDKLMRSNEEAIGGQRFAFSGGVQRDYEQSSENMQESFGMTRTNLLSRLEQQTAKIEQWRAGEQSRLENEKRRLQAENKMLSKKDSFFEALGF